MPGIRPTCDILPENKVNNLICKILKCEPVKSQVSGAAIEFTAIILKKTDGKKLSLLDLWQYFVQSLHHGIRDGNS
jgi:hypothetical protein